MKTEDLRLNNIVKVHWEDEHRWCALDFWEGIEFEPIPLTEEWLERFGFEFLECFVNNKEWKVTDYYKEAFTNKWGLRLSKGVTNPDCFYFFHENIGRQIEYVHQLQNLYHALTGEELTIIK